jgi:hypothetical protein
VTKPTTHSNEARRFRQSTLNSDRAQTTPTKPKQIRQRCPNNSDGAQHLSNPDSNSAKQQYQQRQQTFHKFVSSDKKDNNDKDNNDTVIRLCRQH